ncbi:MAG: PfkB family carbohydrate kinase [Pseudomonadota bacterium]
MPRPVILVVGSLHHDIMVEAGHLPRKDETAIGTRWYPKFGGKGGNQAVAVVAQGGTARMLGAVGRDAFGHFLRAGLQAGGVDAGFVRDVAGTGSGMSVAIQDADGDYAATIVPGANLMIGADWLADAALWQDVGLLVLQNEIPEPINLAAATAARARGIRTLFNAGPFRPLPRAFEALVDILVVNAVEAEMMGAGQVASLDAAADAARALSARFGAVIVTAGSLGLAARAAEDAFALPARRVDAVSAHGAGDCFIGALAAALVKGDGFRDACALASEAAALHVAGRTPRPDAPPSKV